MAVKPFFIAIKLYTGIQDDPLNLYTKPYFFFQFNIMNLVKFRFLEFLSILKDNISIYYILYDYKYYQRIPFKI